MALNIEETKNKENKIATQNFNKLNSTIFDFEALSADEITKFDNYTYENYKVDVETQGLQTTWVKICSYVLNNPNKSEFLKPKNYGELYEEGLAIQDKYSKKSSGQYFTPEDICSLMSTFLKNECNGKNLCDAGCGTGNLVLSYLNLLPLSETKKLIRYGHLYLYDLDKTAMMICWTIIALTYGIDNATHIHCEVCDFLDKNTKLPESAKVIANPPYSKITEIKENWEMSEVITKTKEFYSAFMEKIFEQADSCVIITPFSFINGTKFYPLRKKICELGTGSIYSFDNVPGNIFCGRKHGIFNTNQANSVRAAITVFNRTNNDGEKGFKISPLIRFRTDEREQVIKIDVLKNITPYIKQIVDENHKEFSKVFNSLYPLFNAWVTNSKYVLKDFISTKANGKYIIDMPNTCRYYTTASSKKLSRGGSIEIKTDIERNFEILYCFINSSFTYWWWRIYDGAITYPLCLLMNLPIPLNLMNDEDFNFFHEISTEMISQEDSFKITKLNAKVVQENIKFPEKYRKAINQRIIKILGRDDNEEILDVVHKNNFFGDK